VTDDERQLGADANRAQDEVGESRWSALVLPVSEADALAARRGSRTIRLCGWAGGRT